MAAEGDELQENLEQYEAQLSQVEAALMIDEDNDELKRLKLDLQEVLTLTRELLDINEPEADANITECGNDSSQWKVGQRCQAIRKTDQKYYNGTIDMIADDKISCTVKFDNSGSVEIIALSELLPEVDFASSSAVTAETSSTPAPAAAAASSSAKQPKLTREEMEKRKENKKLKLQKKKLRMKEFEAAREAGKQRWQSFYKKGSLKGKHKMKGINKKSIFASDTDGKGKIGIGTCGKMGRTMTEFASPSQYMYKK